MISVQDRASWPKEGSVWVHMKTNEKYVVMFFTNIEGTRPRYPTMIIYKRFDPLTENWYSRPLADWDRSFTLNESEK